MLDQLQRAHEIRAAGLEALPDDVVTSGRPMVLREAVADWPFVREARRSDEAAVAYLNRFYNGRPVNALVAPPSELGRFFYRPDSKKMNFELAPGLLERFERYCRIESTAQRHRTQSPSTPGQLADRIDRATWPYRVGSTSS